MTTAIASSIRLSRKNMRGNDNIAERAGPFTAAAGARAPDTARRGEPAPVPGHGQLVPLEVVHAPGPAREHEDVRAGARHPHVQRDTVDVHHP